MKDTKALLRRLLLRLLALLVCAFGLQRLARHLPVVGRLFLQVIRGDGHKGAMLLLLLLLLFFVLPR